MNININTEKTDMMMSKTASNVSDGTSLHNGIAVIDKAFNKGYLFDASSEGNDNKAYGNHKKTMEEIISSASNIDVTARRNYMAVMSNTLSTEDFAKLNSEGIDPGETDFDEVVTIVDHIKAALIKGGKNISGYTDDISKEALTAITGSESYASDLISAFYDKDIPLNESNAKDVEDNYKVLSQINTISEGTKKYLVENDLRPTVENLYTATYSGAADPNRQSRGYYNAGDVEGYYAKKSDDIDVDGLMPQIEKVIEDTGLEINDSNVNKALWLVDKGVPLTSRTLISLHEIETVKLPMNHAEFASKAADAISDGIRVKETDLSRNESMRKEAENINDEVKRFGTIKGKRVREEVRLVMSAQANLRLLKSGYRIDIAPMEDLVNRLKDAEGQIARMLTGESNPETAIEKKKIYTATIDLVNLIKAAPINIVDAFESKDSLPDIGKKAEDLRLSYEKAGKEYEKLMSAPRYDMGDSITKAFGNVDEVLNRIDEPLTEENRRAVRILAYNSIEVTSQALLQIKEKDKLLCDTVDNMTPGRVLKMIKSGVNPIVMPIDELNKYLKDQDTSAEDMLSYSRFLYRVDKAHDITDDEKEAYIGIYRLINQVKKSDNSSIGAIDELNMSYNLENLLTVIRSKKRTALNYKVDDTFGGLDVKENAVKSITSQIQKGFIKDTKDIENMLKEIGDDISKKEIIEEEAARVRDSYRTENEVLTALLSYDNEISADNITNMDIMMNNPVSVFEKLKVLGYRKDFDVSSLENKKSANKAYKDFTGNIKEFLNNEVFGDKQIVGISDHDRIKEIAQLYKHFEFLDNHSDDEDYEIPVEIGGDLTAINLKVIHKKDEGSKVSISFDSEVFGKVASEFNVNNNEFFGFCTIANKEKADILSNNIQTLKKMFSDEGINLNSMYFVNGENLNLSEFNVKQSKDRATDTDVITSDTLYRSAKVFIGFMKESAYTERI